MNRYVTQGGGEQNEIVWLGEKKEWKSIHPFNINTFNNYYNTLNECDDFRKMLKTNCTVKAPSKAAIGWKLKEPYNMKYHIN